MAWPLVKLKDCCTVVGGATPKRNVPEYWGHDVPWVTPKDISKLNHPMLEDAPEYISRAGFENSATFMLPKGSILLTSRAPIGNVAIAGRGMCTNQGFKSLVPSDRVDSSYLFHCIKKMSRRLQALGNGATFKEVSKKVVEEFEIPLPPLAEQKHIAAILDKADAIRRKRQHAIDLTDQLLRAVFLDMFGDPGFNPNQFIELSLGELNKNKMNNGLFRKNDDYGGSMPVAWVGELFKGKQIDLSESRCVEPTKKELKSYGMKYGDLLFCRSSLKLEGIGWNNIYLGEDNKALFECHIIRMQSNTEMVNPIFLSYQLRLNNIRKRVFQQAKTVTMTTIDQDGLSKVRVMLPPLEEQNKFAEFLVTLTDRFPKQNNSLESIGCLKNSLTQRAFRGELTKQTKAA